LTPIVIYNLIQMTFERKALRIVLRKMFRDYRERLARIFEEAGAGRGSQMLGAALVAVTEGFSLQLMVTPRVFKRADVRRSVARAVRARLTNG
jgi:hypothetical protein